MNRPHLEYVFSDRRSFTIANDVRDVQFDVSMLNHAIIEANQVMLDIGGYDINIGEILGMRNLSAFVGEVLARSIVKVSDGLFLSNPHQDGYPDLLLMDEVGQEEYAGLAERLRDKLPFSPFRTGGIEVKATCGSAPTPAILQRRGLVKPGIGDQRITLLTGYDWKAHHRDTNNLLGVFWDFIDETPVIAAVFYSSDLEEADWGEIVAPRTGGGRTTSVSIMRRPGIRKMYDGCLCVLADDKYIDFFNRRNQATMLSSDGF